MYGKSVLASDDLSVGGGSLGCTVGGATGVVPFRKIGVETGRYRRQLTNHIIVTGLVALPWGCVQEERKPPHSKEKLGRVSVLQRKQPLLRVETFCCVRA